MIMADDDGHGQAADGGTRLESREDAERELGALDADFGNYYEFGYDKAGWDAWPLMPHGADLHAGTPAELRAMVGAELRRVRPPC
jgi:hypothetical protein